MTTPKYAYEIEPAPHGGFVVFRRLFEGAPAEQLDPDPQHRRLVFCATTPREVAVWVAGQYEAEARPAEGLEDDVRSMARRLAPQAVQATPAVPMNQAKAS